MLASILLLGAAALSVSATNVHANKGCILVNGQAICQGAVVVVDDGQATINAMYNGADTGDEYVNAGCQLQASWPSDYGDIYYGANSCLYDASGNNIGRQCCRAGSGGQYTLNPYH